MSIEDEFKTIDENSSWLHIYQKIKQDCLIHHDFSVKDAKRAEFKGRNRYRDVSPYDHNRIILKRNGIDYINASLLNCDHVKRSYILTQGPLPNTAGHFWLMVWEHNSKAVLMLNRVIEKGQIKCYQYFPTGAADNEEMTFDDVNLKVQFISEETAEHFSIRTLELEDLESNTKKQVLQFHYTTWPDFGVPNSPKAFLEFLFAVRNAGVLDTTVGPPVIHCSAGIGRSGTFCLVDTCLVQIEKEMHANQNVCDILMDMRESRMGLIQTADQLRFSYMAIIEGYRDFLQLDIIPSSSLPDDLPGNLGNPQGLVASEDARYEADDDQGISPNNNNNQTDESDQDTHNVDTIPTQNRGEEQEIRRRKREERKKKTSEQIAKMKKKQQDCEKWKIKKKSMQPYLWGLSVAVLVGSCIVYQCYA